MIKSKNEKFYSKNFYYLILSKRAEAVRRGERRDMVKKIFDIIPPSLVSNKEEKINNLKKEGKKKKKRKFAKKILPSFFKLILLLSCFLIIFLVVYLYFKLPFANIEIWPGTRTISFEEIISAETAVKTIEGENKKIPAQFIEVEKEMWQEFSSTGSITKEGKAEGVIRVYNKYTPPKTIEIVKNTRFISDSGKIFYTLEKFTIPAAKIEKGKVIPGSVEVRVVAAAAGEEYNIGPSVFAVPGLAGTALYHNIYAESTAKMSGGYKSVVKVITAQDIEGAKSNLTERVFADNEAALKEQANNAGMIIIKNALSHEVLNSDTSLKIGSEVEKFDYTVKVKTRALVFKEADLKELAKTYIIERLPESTEVLEKSLFLEYNPITINLSAGKITLNLKSSAQIYPLIDKKELSLLLVKKNPSQIKEIIYSYLNEKISDLKINLSPFWVKKAPKNPQRIKIELKFD